uniref:hypothetical protein n=1 Tax=Campylaephora boydenii TaxID=202204 RepID=UPI002551F727|nr:hypothetical protein QQR83_pgp053 [Campylaephora boydenii]WGT74086.1 hypothetical protein [Campylaephora boydenii]
MKLFNQQLDNLFNNKKVVKIISGIDNLNINNVVQYIQACEIGKATYVDIAANPEIVHFIKQITNLPVCVSSINIKALYDSVLAGADLVEIGNFDVFYKQGIILSPQQIVNISKQIRVLLPNTDICVTIPHTFNLNEQIELALRLEDIGINIVQTEGNMSKLISSNLSKLTISQDYLFYSILQTSAALSSVYFLSNVVNIPVIASSGINSLTAPIAFAYGASGIGIRSEVSKFNSINKMSCRIHEIIQSLDINISNIKSINNDSILDSLYSYLDKSIFYSI